MLWLIPAIIAGATALVGAATAADIAHDTNKANADENEKNRQASKELQQMQNDYNTQMYLQNNQYNDYSNQVARLRQAGINPAMMYQNGSGLQLATAPTGAANGVPGSVPMQQYQSGLGDVANIAMNLHEQRDKSAAADLSEYNRDIKAATLSDELTARIAELQQKGVKTQADKVALDIAKKQLFMLDKTMNFQIEQKEQDLLHVKLGNEYQAWFNFIQPEKWAIERDTLAKQNALTSKQMELADATISKVYTECYELYTRGQLNSANIRKVVQDVVINSPAAASAAKQAGLLRNEVIGTSNAILDMILDKVRGFVSFRR